MSNDNPHSVYQSILGQENVIPWKDFPVNKQELLLSASTLHPSCIIYPNTTEELAQVITQAHQNNWRVLTCGNSSKLDWGGLLQNVDILVSTQRLNRLIEHAVGDLTITVEAGCKFSDIQETLAKANQFLALDPIAPDATIGGIVATGDTSSFRQRYGSVRDQLLGITIVRADGQIAKAGGRVVKNVAGYDLMKLFTGSYGTLGIISQVTFRVYPMQEASGTVVLTGTPEVVSQAANILRSSALTPTKADLLSRKLVGNLGLGDGFGLIACFQSIVESVKEQCDRLIEVGNKLNLQSQIFSGNDETDLWQRLQKQMYYSNTEHGITCKIGVLPTAAVEVLLLGEEGLVHNGSGLGWLRFEDASKVEGVRLLCQNHRGFLTILASPMEVKQKLDIWGYEGTGLKLMQQIKKKFDERNILNPGRFVGGI